MRKILRSFFDTLSKTPPAGAGGVLLCAGCVRSGSTGVFDAMVKMTEKMGKICTFSLSKKLTILFFRIILFINLGKAKALTEEIYK